jgi:hypothetical protein
MKGTRNDIGGPERIRTSDLRFRKPLLYPTELRDQLKNFVSGSLLDTDLRPLNILLYSIIWVTRQGATAAPPATAIERDPGRAASRGTRRIDIL